MSSLFSLNIENSKIFELNLKNIQQLHSLSLFRNGYFKRIINMPANSTSLTVYDLDSFDINNKFFQIRKSSCEKN